MRRFRNSIDVLLGCLLLSAPVAMADEGGLRSGFFEKGTVRDVFGDQMKPVAAAPYEYFPAQPPKIEEAPPQQRQPAAPAPSASAGGVVAPAKASAAPILAADTFTPEVELKNAELSPFVDPAAQNAKDDLVAQKMLATYGDPDKEAPVKAIDNAPGPFKAIMEAMEAGRDDLAEAYARQYVRHLKNIQTRSQKVMEFTAKALESEKQAAVQEEEAANLIKGNQEVDAQAKALVAKIARGEGLKQDTEAFGFQTPNRGVRSPGNVSETEERNKIRASFTGKVPVDPQGKVDIYFFFDPSDPTGLQMAQEMETFYRMSRQRGNVNLAGMTLKPLASAQEKALREHTGASYPITAGDQLYKVLKLSGSPVTVLVAETTGESRIESGMKPAVYLDELLKVMEGRKA